MDRQENMKKALKLMDMTAHSGRHHDLKPWLELKLTREQLRVIILLSFKEPVTPGVVAREFGVPKANVTTVINSLVEKGYIKRYENPNDRRSYLLSLTKEGKEQVDKLREFRSTIMKKILERISDEDLSCLVKGFEALVKAMKEEGKKSGSNKS